MFSVADSLKIKNLVLSSRLVRSATAERLIMEKAEDGRLLGELYAELVRGGVGLVITGHIAVHPTGRVSALMPVLDDALGVAAWREAAAAVHAVGGLVAVQLNHGGGRAHPSADVQPYCVSSLPDRPRDPLQGAVLDVAGIELLIAAFAQSARLAREAGMDAVQIHAAHGYLGSQFLSPTANRRGDEWGGSLENRARFLRRVIRAVRASVGADFPIGMKLGALDDDPSGLSAADALQAAAWFQEDGLDFIEISGAFHAAVCLRHLKPGPKEGYYLPLARQFKERLSIPVIVVGGWRSLETINAAIGSGACDAVSLARPLIRQPDLLALLRQGGRSECIGCNLCLLTNDRRTECHALRRQNMRAKTG